MACGLRFITLLSCLQLTFSRILLFWSVDSGKRTQELVQANVQHVKDLRVEHDVILAHYRGSRKDWDQKWYRQHVRHSLGGMGYKFHFLQKAYKLGEWEKRYEYIWALDSDIDISRADVLEFLQMARQIGAPIVGPTFVQKRGTSFAQDSLGVIRREGHSPSSHRHHQLSTGPNKIQLPDPGCDFRHTDFVELTAPLLKSSVLKSILVDCKHCIHEKSDWGLDMMWCKYVSERSGEAGCALVDKAPVTHLDWELAPISHDFYAAMHAVQAQYSKFWSEHRVLDCKHQQGGLVENIVEDTIRPHSAESSQDASARMPRSTSSGPSEHSPSNSQAQKESEDAASDDEEPDSIAAQTSNRGSANVSAQRWPSNSSQAQKESEDAASDDEEPDSTAAQTSSRGRANVSAQPINSSQAEEPETEANSHSPESEDSPFNGSAKTQVTGQGIFKVKARAASPSVSKHGEIGEDGTFKRGSLGSEVLPSGEVEWRREDTGQWSKTGAQVEKAIDAQGHVGWSSGTALLSLGAFQEAELRVRDDIENLRHLEEELTLLLPRAPKGTKKVPAKKRHRSSKKMKHKHSKMQKVSLIDLGAEDSETHEDAQSAQIRALAAGAHELAIEAAQEVHKTVGEMSLQQLKSVREAALQSVEKAIAEQVRELESHDSHNAQVAKVLKSDQAVMANRIKELEAKLHHVKRQAFRDHQVEELKVSTLASRLNATDGKERLLMLEWAQQIFNLKAQLSWDQKRMRSEMQDELMLKNKLRHLEADRMNS